MTKFLFILLLPLILSSCGESKKTSHQMKISFGAALSANAPTMIYGVRADGPERFGMKLITSTTSVELINGNWTFSAITWNESTNYMEGDPHCGETTMILKGEPKIIAIDMTKENCKSDKWMGAHGWTMDPGTIFQPFVADICSSNTAYANFISVSSCYGDATGVNGMEVSFPEYDLTGHKPLGIKSACYKASYGSFNTPLKIPYGTNEDFPLYTILKFFKSPQNCTGSSCCQGTPLELTFARGLWKEQTDKTANATNGSSIRLRIKQPEMNRLTLIAPSVAVQNQCVLTEIRLTDGQSNPAITEEPLTLDLTCDGGCLIYAGAGCTGPTITTATIPAGSSSAYVTLGQSNFITNFSATPPASTGLVSVNLQITAPPDYSLVNLPYLMNMNMGAYAYPVTVPSLAIPDQMIVFRTNQGHYGKMRILFLQTTNVPMDTVVFTFTTFDAAGNVLVESAYGAITACADPMTNTCSLDFEYSNPVTLANGIETEVWFQNMGGIFYWNINNPANPMGTLRH